ncbi:MAG: hypothetical protein LDL41_23315 [Coleofasciculus sp. S288]|nr:hypothetical protein [Coleofasciculus sp. S288]
MTITAIAPLPMNPTLQSVLTHLKHDLADFCGDRFLFGQHGWHRLRLFR